jgi:hypothetical protein
MPALYRSFLRCPARKPVRTSIAPKPAKCKSTLQTGRFLSSLWGANQRYGGVTLEAQFSSGSEPASGRHHCEGALQVERCGKRSVVEKRKIKKVLPFPSSARPAPLEVPSSPIAIFQIGDDRFAVHMWCEDLPPLPRQLMSEHADLEEEPTLSPVPPRRNSARRTGASATRRTGASAKRSTLLAAGVSLKTGSSAPRVKPKPPQHRDSKRNPNAV